MTTFNMKTGDLEPPLVIDISGSSGDLNDVVSWRVIGRRRATAELLFEDPDPGHEVDGEDPSKAVVTHHWVAGETDTPGVVHVEVEALWPSDRRQTFPAVGYAQVRIGDDLDETA